MKLKSPDELRSSLDPLERGRTNLDVVTFSSVRFSLQIR
jgi:hypothetical protein